MASYNFYCTVHQVLAESVEIKAVCTTISCSGDKKGHESQIPSDVVAKISDIPIEAAMLNKMMSDSHGLQLLCNLWSEMPDDFPFTLKSQL